MPVYQPPLFHLNLGYNENHMIFNMQIQTKQYNPKFVVFQCSNNLLPQILKKTSQLQVVLKNYLHYLLQTTLQPIEPPTTNLLTILTKNTDFLLTILQLTIQKNGKFIFVIPDYLFLNRDLTPTYNALLQPLQNILKIVYNHYTENHYFALNNTPAPKHVALSQNSTQPRKSHITAQILKPKVTVYTTY
ncbi:hypothetical protein SS50377_24881 [Spironucleus salmonicida]|uniref:Uncharacterized protein n=1 Tax=Spironucleus salmonicida TaxID=348837 RepID=V6LHF6_9EUKA|nr:hypothetical protein SS50377_24881 [Spironucleus salmonicida]|eukprot:EST43146.1 Hypothetical protein SS50377_17203 [Spironucleus salmonicida]